jgi:hypothetical protein
MASTFVFSLKHLCNLDYIELLLQLCKIILFQKKSVVWKIRPWMMLNLKALEKWRGIILHANFKMEFEFDLLLNI